MIHECWTYFHFLLISSCVFMGGSNVIIGYLLELELGKSKVNFFKVGGYCLILLEVLNFCAN